MICGPFFADAAQVRQRLPKHRRQLVIGQLLAYFGSASGQLSSIYAESQVSVTAARVDLRLEYVSVVDHGKIAGSEYQPRAELFESHYSMLNEVQIEMIVLERAAIDAVCRLVGASFETVVLDDLIGLKATLSAPTLAAYLQWQGCKAGSESVAIRHTVGLDDPLIARPGEGRPTGLAEVIATDQVSRFKLKVPATIDAALDRLNEVAVLLNHALPGGYTITLDANEAFDDPDPFAEFMNRLATTPRLGRFWRSIAYLEQPFRRDVAFDVNLGAMSLGKPVIIDESDDASDAFARAIGCGYGGVSVKTCKGVVHGLRNLMLAKATGCFVSAEDLCVQPGLGLQQNLALAGVLGVPDCERNGHHYGPGPIALPLEERMQFEALHPDLYSADTGTLNIERGELSLRSTRPAKGFGTTVVPVHANPSQIR